MQEPPLLEAGFLVDIVTAQQLFAFHLPDMCTKRSKSSTLFNTIADYARLHNSIVSFLGYFPKQEVRDLPEQSASSVQHGATGMHGILSKSSTKIHLCNKKELCIC